jgi:Pre-mRNA 3'-end-processing endonuclease polyadenylation factor C-term/Beta-Casp domain/Zn-dependent metallo-hydrolase RNA specificity domain
LILDEYWTKHQSLHTVPIYYASALARRCMMVYKTYLNMMNRHIQKQAEVSNPFQFNHILNFTGMNQFEDTGPCVIMASPGMLQNGLSRELFEMWCPDQRNSCIIPGYCVEGTLAKTIMDTPTEIMTLAGYTAPLRMGVHYVSFSAHADFKQTSEFVDALRPPHIILVHGEENQMRQMRQKLQQVFQDGTMQIQTPTNCQAVELEFRSQKIAKVIGSLAAEEPVDGSEMSGVLVRRDFDYQFMQTQDLPNFTNLDSTAVTQTLTVPFNQSYDCLWQFLAQMYELSKVGDGTNESSLSPSASASASASTPASAAASGPDSADDNKSDTNMADATVKSESPTSAASVAVSATTDVKPVNAGLVSTPLDATEVPYTSFGSIDVSGAVTIHVRRSKNDIKKTADPRKAKAIKAQTLVSVADHIVLEWNSNPVNDMIADSLIALVMSIEGNPGAAKLIGVSHGHQCNHTKVADDAKSGSPKSMIASTKSANWTKFDSQLISSLFAQHFEFVDIADGKLRIVSSDNKEYVATVDMIDKTVECNDETLREHVCRVRDWVTNALLPLPASGKGVVAPQVLLADIAEQEDQLDEVEDDVGVNVAQDVLAM